MYYFCSHAEHTSKFLHILIMLIRRVNKRRKRGMTLSKPVIGGLLRALFTSKWNITRRKYKENDMRNTYDVSWWSAWLGREWTTSRFVLMVKETSYGRKYSDACFYCVLVLFFFWVSSDVRVFNKFSVKYTLKLFSIPQTLIFPIITIISCLLQSTHSSLPVMPNWVVVKAWHGVK